MHDELRRYVACRDAGDLKGALSAASAACHAAPGAAEPHYAYGEAWLALGEVVRSGQAFAAAAERRPEWVDAWVNLGLAHYRAGAIWPAKLALRRALSLAPGHAVARANLAALMRISGESEGAEALLRDTLARDPGNAGARLNLVADLLQEERPGDALALLDAAPGLPADPTALRHWHLQRVLALLQLGRAAEAREGLRAVAALGPVPAELAPLWHWRWLLLAKAEGRPAVAGAAAERMARALSAMGPRAVPEHRIMGHYDLAKFWSSNGDLDAAFANWQAGHTLLRPTQPFSREEHRAFADASIALLDSARLSAGARAANADPAPVFIVGMPRSGTTLCEQILAAHAQVHGAGADASKPAGRPGLRALP